jgi:hypothetical protein
VSPDLKQLKNFGGGKNHGNEAKNWFWNIPLGQHYGHFYGIPLFLRFANDALPQAGHRKKLGGFGKWDSSHNFGFNAEYGSGVACFFINMANYFIHSFSAWRKLGELDLICLRGLSTNLSFLYHFEGPYPDSGVYSLVPQPFFNFIDFCGVLTFVTGEKRITALNADVK